MTDVRWRGQSHETLYSWINGGPGARAAVPQLEYWEGLKKSLTDISDRLNSSLAKIGASWEGAAGQSAHAGLTPMRQWAETAQQSAHVMRQSAQEQADLVSTARAAMPEPVPQTTPAPTGWAMMDAAKAKAHGNMGPAAAIAKQAGDHEAQETASANAHERAVQVMSNYQNSSEHNMSTLAQFFAPPDIVVEVGDTPLASVPGKHYTSHGVEQTVSQGVDATGSVTSPVHQGGGHGLGPVPGNPQGGALSGAGTNAPAAPGGAPLAAQAGHETPLGSANNYNSAAAATMGGSAALGALGSRVMPARPGAVASASLSLEGRQGGQRSDAEKEDRAIKRAASPSATSASANEPLQQPGQQAQQGQHAGPVGGAPMGGAGAGMGGGETTRGGNPYLANRGLIGANPDARGFQPLDRPQAPAQPQTQQPQTPAQPVEQRPAAAERSGAVVNEQPQYQQHQAPSYQQSTQGQHAAGPAGTPSAGATSGASTMPQQVAPAAHMPVNQSASPAAAGPMHAQEHTNENNSYLVKADDVFGDDERRVAPPVIGEDFE